MPDKDLSQHLLPIRQKIDAIDDKIITLLCQRAKLAARVGKIKQQENIKTYAILEREVEIVKRLQKKFPEFKDHIAPIYTEIISACIAFERPTQVAILGPHGTYSHEMALKLFGHSAGYHPVSSISNAVTATEQATADFSVIPFENSSAGTIGESLDQLIATPLIINGEGILRIRHHLLVHQKSSHLTLKQIKKIYAHPQALEQCREWLRKKTPNAALFPTTSTAAAAQKIMADNKAVAAIGSLTAKNYYQLSDLASSIEDNKNNSTRFLILGERLPQPTGTDKTSFIVAAGDEAGAMSRLLAPLEKYKINMSKLESRPNPKALWEYYFYIDIDGHQHDKKIAQALNAIKNNARFFKILGSYPYALK